MSKQFDAAIKRNQAKHARWAKYEKLLRRLRQRIFDYEDNGRGEQASRLIAKCKNILRPKWEAEYHTRNTMLTITFEHSHNKYPNHTEGPFEWVEVIGSNMFGLRPGFDEADEIAGVNKDGCTWDAGPYEHENRERRAYTRWTISVFKPQPPRKWRGQTP